MVNSERNETNNNRLASIAAILCTLAEVAPNGEVVPASSVYLGIGMDMIEYTYVINILTTSGYVKATPSTIRITIDGKNLADKLNAKIGRVGGVS